jgi:FkbM family methyltransferase
MKYFLDFGTHFFDQYHPGNTGTSPNGLITTFYDNGYMSGGDWIVKTYEPSKSIYQANLPYVEDVKKKFYEFEAVNAAVMDYTGTVNFRMMLGNPAGSNCVDINPYMQDVVDESKRDEIDEYETTCIDICDILTEIINKDSESEIHIKCDIEGSEFKVLPKLLLMEDLEKYLKRIFIEWHERYWQNHEDYGKICNIKSTVIDNLIKKGIEVHTHW